MKQHLQHLLTSAVVVAAVLCATPNSGAQAPQMGSAPAPQSAQQQNARPNVLMWMMDDVGFAHVSSFGGLIRTPNIDRVAALGLRYTNYHTAPICSASRAAMLTGRNPHTVNIGGHALVTRPIPGYNGKIPAEAGTLAANLRQAGYVNFALGKWDHLPSSEMNLAGPFDRWPTGQGFDRFYGFLAADTDNWDPVLLADTTPVNKPYKANYHLDKDLSSQAIAMIQSRSVAATKAPFFMYYATGTAHAPHHAPAEWIAQYKGVFDMGWDKARETILKRQIAKGLVPATTKLAPMGGGLPAWDSLNPEQKRLYARQMEVFAAALSHADEQFGRVLDGLQASGELDNTIIVITSDNGASAEGAERGGYNELLMINGRPVQDDKDNLPFFDKWGGPETYPHYANAWAVAGNTPFLRYKQTPDEGGTRVPFIVAWPKGIKARGELRQQYAYVTDVAPTLMELANVPLAETVNNVKQMPMDGLSFKTSLSDARAADKKDSQYIELWGSKALWSKGWSINATNRVRTWDRFDPVKAAKPWELYNLNVDPGQTTDLAAKYPDKVAELAAKFDEQAKRYNVYPLADMDINDRAMQTQARDEFVRRGGRWVYDGPVGHIGEWAAAPTTLRPFTLTASLDLPAGNETGPVHARGGKHGGMALYLKDGVPNFILRDLAGKSVVVTAGKPLPKGQSQLQLSVDFANAPPLQPKDIKVTMRSNGQEIATKVVNIGLPFVYSISETFDVGIDYGSVVSDDYKGGEVFPGKLSNIVFDFNKQ